jgi:hypothetical protein
MSNTMSAFIAKRINATLGGKGIYIAITTTVCMYDDYIHWGSLSESVKRFKDVIDRRRERYACLPVKPSYFVNSINDQSKNAKGLTVFKVPEKFDGSHNDYDLEKLEKVGMLLKDGNNWYVETDSQVMRKFNSEKMIELSISK